MESQAIFTPEGIYITVELEWNIARDWKTDQKTGRIVSFPYSLWEKVISKQKKLYEVLKEAKLRSKHVWPFWED